MKRKLTESTIIFISILRWSFLAAVIGVLVGLSTTAFLKILNWSTATSGQYPFYFILLPVAFVLSSALVKYLAPDAEGHGTEKVIEAVHKRSGKINILVVPVKLISTIITIASGGSAGKEGPCAQIGGGLASAFSDLFKFTDNDRKKLVICGISAGFASVFGTPIAGAIFGVEVLFVGGIIYEVLLPSFVAGIISFHVSSGLGISYFYKPFSFVPVFSGAFFLKVIFAGIFFGICSFILIELLTVGKSLYGRLKMSFLVKNALGGIFLVGLTLIFSKHYLGLGLDTIESVLRGTKIIWYAFLVKTVFTSITLNFGGSGGIITPIFFIGATAGSLFAQILKLDPATFSAIGLVAVLSGAANTPIAASILAVELFGAKIAPYAAIASVISFFMTGHRSVYPSQVLSIKKEPSMSVEIGQEMEDVSPEFHLQKKGVFTTYLRFIRMLGNKLKKKP